MSKPNRSVGGIKVKAHMRNGKPVKSYTKGGSGKSTLTMGQKRAALKGMSTRATKTSISIIPKVKSVKKPLTGISKGLENIAKYKKSQIVKEKIRVRNLISEKKGGSSMTTRQKREALKNISKK